MAPHTLPTAACDGSCPFLRPWEHLMPALPAFFMVHCYHHYLTTSMTPITFCP